MVTFAIKTVDDSRVREYLQGISHSLQHPDYIRSPFSGVVRPWGRGVYLLSVKPLYPRILLNMMAFMMVLSSIIIYVIGLETLGFVCFAVGLAMSFVITLFFSPSFYQVIIWLQIRRMLGHFYMVSRAEEHVLEMIAYGTRRDS